MSILAPFDKLLHNGALYLLLHLSDPTSHESSSRDFYSKAVNMTSSATSFQIDCLPLDVKSQLSGRFVLSLPEVSAMTPEHLKRLRRSSTAIGQ